jgi:uncharacterized protein YcbX
MAGVVASINRYPVKSMLGEELDAATVSERGLVGDRAYALIDDDTGKVVSVKRPKRWGRIFELVATTQRDSTHGGTTHGGTTQGGTTQRDTVVVTFPDGTSDAIDASALPERLSAFFGRKVSVASVPPEGATYDEAWVGELKDGARPYFGMPSRTEDGGEMIDAIVSLGVPGGFFDFGAIHIVTTSTVRALSKLAPGSRFDALRFRPNIVVETEDAGFLETAWQGHALTIGEVRLSVSFTVPRCVMTTLAQGDLPADREVLRTIAQHNVVDVFGTGTPYPCVGVYADVTAGGTIRTGDPVTLD